MIDQLARTKTLAEDTLARVEALIVTLELEPGTLFSEGDLARALSVGRTPLREALQRLAADGLVTALPRRGMMVAPIDLPGMLSIIETRKVLDRIIMTGAAQHATGSQRAAVRVALDALAQAREADFMAADYQLDHAIWDAAPNQFAVQASRPLHSHCRRFWYRYRADQDLKRSTDLHNAAIEAVLSGDAVAAAERSDKLMDYLTLFTKHILIAR